jgi:hypothetical protein
VAAKSKEERAQVRSTVSRIVTEVFDEEYIREVAEGVKGLTRGQWGEGTCPECGSRKKVMVEIPDIASQLKALTTLLEQAEGKVQAADADGSGVTLVIHRTWPEKSTDPPS